MTSFCCDAFANAAGHTNTPIGGGGLYPSSMRPEGQIEQDEDGGWNVNGCCGGGCYVLTGLRYCPFCGSRLEASPLPSPLSRD